MLTYEQFTERLAAHLRGLPGVRGARQDGDAIDVTMQQGDETLRVSPGNFFAGYVRAPWTLTDELDRCGRTVAAFVAQAGRRWTWDEVRPYLRLKLESAARVGNERLARPFAPGLVACPAIDSPDSVSFLTPSALALLGVTEDDVYTEATRHMDALDVSIVYQALDGDRVGFVAFMDGFAASRLLRPMRLLTAWEGSRPEGRLIVFAPHRDLLILVPYGNVAVALVAGLTARRVYAQNPYQISPAPYVIEPNGTVRPFSAT
jgi:Protein of unknown function (DUF1444)